MIVNGYGIQLITVPAASTGRGERTPEKATTRRAITREISSATVYAVKGAGGTVVSYRRVTLFSGTFEVEETVPTVRSINTSDARSIALSPANLTPSDIGSPIVQKRIEIVEQDERRRRKEEDDNRMKKDEEKRKKREKDEEERKKREKDEEERKRKKEEDDKISSEMSKESINGRFLSLSMNQFDMIQMSLNSTMITCRNRKDIERRRRGRLEIMKK